MIHLSGMLEGFLQLCGHLQVLPHHGLVGHLTAEGGHREVLWGAPTITQFSLLFENFIHSNGVRAQRQEVPMTYQEILVLWSTHINLPTLDTNSLGTAVQNELKKMHLLPNKRGGGGTEGSSAAKSPRPDRDTRFCPNWNSPPGCTNTPTQGGCSDPTGKFLKHSCSKRLTGGKFCGSDRHGLPSH
jgi:hypothetical protein